ncbi:MAG: excinuclease ABC subunit C [Desulfobulbus propionicus]|nr:MAG: excinuclease ABC subunit C [Desulfobulbus propionicus]
MVMPQSRPATSPLTPDLLKTISCGPGVYQMLSKKEVIYVGKAVNLRKRLAQYAHFSGPSHSKTQVMLRHVIRVDTILTTTEKEALILEASLIKKHRPRYNVILRDDKNYPLVKVSTAEEWPRITVTRKKLRDNNRYFGPYASAAAMRATLKLLYSLFPLRRCKKVRPRKRPCINFQMKRCLAPCVGMVEREVYLGMVKDVLHILEGKAEQVKAELKEQMQAAAETLQFEKAALYRDQLRGLITTLEHQTVVASHHADQDVYGLKRQGAAVGIAILFVRAGAVTGAQTFFIPDPLGDDAALLSEAILQYYSRQHTPPREVLLPLQIEDQEMVREYLMELRDGTCDFFIPRRGKRMQLMQMAAENAEKVFSDKDKKEKSWAALAASLQYKLKLSRQPEVIECLDISNLQGKQAVGSLVTFISGEKAASQYRHYRIQTKDTPDDYAMMAEVLKRRFSSSSKKHSFPDLLLLDGGKGQLSTACSILQSLDIFAQMDVAGIAKERQDEGEKIFRPGRKNPVILRRNDPALLLLMQIRDEAHRFGITFHRKLRSKAALHSRLDALVGIGTHRKTILLRHFGSVKKILKADHKALAEVPGIGAKLAESIYAQLHSSRQNGERVEAD